jgi:hypothetical protein
MKKGYLEKSGFWSIKIRIALCVYILIKNLISNLILKSIGTKPVRHFVLN